MKKLSFIFNILKRRVFNILLLSVMFSALLLIFMVGFSIKDIFYDYIRSSYGNIADMQVKLNNITDDKMSKLAIKIKHIDKNIDIVYGYEGIYKLSIKDEEESILTKDMPTFIRGLNLQNKLHVELDDKRVWLDIVEFEYDDRLKIQLDLNTLHVKDKNSIKFIAKGREVEVDFCTKTSINNNIYTIESKYCKDNIDYFFKRLHEKEAKFLTLNIDSKEKKLEILELDELYRTIVLKYDDKDDIKEIEIDLEEINILNSSIQSIESYDGELIIVFKREERVELLYKRFISKILRNYFNYNRFILNVKHYAFADEADSEKDPFKEELVWLNELTDFLDLLRNSTNNSAIASKYLANDLNNFGVLDNFNIKYKDREFSSNIRSTFNYNPENLYDKNILYFNRLVLKENFGIHNVNNFIDIYVKSDDNARLEDIKNIIRTYDDKVKFIMQEEIIPSIEPKKKIFNTVVFLFSSLIFLILFISMYVVLRQFYSNFESELALLKLFGLNNPYQTYINFISFFISSVLIYFILKYEESLINEIIMKYFFTSYEFEIVNYVLSLWILLIYILIIYMLEIISIKKLNVIKG